MLAGGHFLLPCFDLLLTRECIGFEDTVDERSKLRVRLVEFFYAFMTFDGGTDVVSISFGLGSDGQLCHLSRRLILYDSFSGSTNVQREGMTASDVVKLRMCSLTDTPPIEALEADIETFRVVLELVRRADRLARVTIHDDIDEETTWRELMTYDGVEALCAILAVDRLSWRRWAQGCRK